VTLPVKIEGHAHPATTVTAARVTTAGQLVTGNLAFDLTSFVQLAVDDQVYNFYQPRAGRQFVISGIIATADKSVAANASATIEIYEGSSTSDATVDRALITFVLTQSTVLPMFPLNILVNEGKFVNARTDDNNIFLTVIGYYIPVVQIG